MRRIWHVAAIALATITATLMMPATAFAAEGNGRCEYGEVCFYYNSNLSGSVLDLTSSRGSYGSGSTCLKFVGPGNGRGQCIKNNTASVWNNQQLRTLRVYYNSNYAGSSQDFGPGSRGNLNSTLKNNNASHQSITFHRSTLTAPGVAFGSSSSPFRVTFIDSNPSQMYVSGTLRDTDGNDNHSVFWHVKVNGSGWSSRIYTSSSVAIGNSWSYGAEARTGVIEVCVDRGTLRADVCVEQGFSKYPAP